MILRISFAFLLASPLLAAASPWEDHFYYEKIPMPEGVDPQIGGLDFFADGRSEWDAEHLTEHAYDLSVARARFG